MTIRYPVRVEGNERDFCYFIKEATGRVIAFGSAEDMEAIAATLNAAHEMRWRTVAEEMPPELVNVIRMLPADGGGEEQTVVYACRERWRDVVGNRIAKIHPTDLWHPLPQPPDKKVGR